MKTHKCIKLTEKQTHKQKKKGSNVTSIENHQTTMIKYKRVKMEKGYKNTQKKNWQMTRVSHQLSAIILNVKRLHTPLKIFRITQWVKKR